MKKKMIGRVSALTVAGVMMFGGMQIPAMAATGDSVVQFQKVLQMENAEGANVTECDLYLYHYSGKCDRCNSKFSGSQSRCWLTKLFRA